MTRDAGEGEVIRRATVRTVLFLALLGRPGGAIAERPLRPIGPPLPTDGRVTLSSAAIRVNQIGYLPREPKVAVVESPEVLTGWRFRVVGGQDGATRYYEGTRG